MAQPDARLAYFAHARDDTTYWGALVIVSAEGDPLDFVYTEPVTLGRVAQTLLGQRADAYVIEKVLLPPLLEQAGPVRLLLFDEPALLRRRLALPVPCVVFAPHDLNHRAPTWSRETIGDRERCWLAATDKTADAKGLLRDIAGTMAPVDVEEPFAQLRAAMAAAKER